ncbi:D-threitol dehydrogenase [Pseudomonas syringae pv. actinidifoliorum]|nr:D-threitol dehydrogenase [Pseudomonas syringae pv. actinidifoliorum]
MNKLTFASAFDFTSKVVIVTGAASGIGLATAELFAERGARLALLDRDPLVLQVAEKLGGKGWIVDIREASQISAAVAAINAYYGRIDVLVNNAGIAITAPAEDLSLDAWNTTMEINLRGQFLLAQAVAPHMFRNGWGRVVTLASQAALIGIDGHTAYSASKAAVIGMSQCLAVEWGPRGVTSNTISPTVVETEMGNKGWSGEIGIKARAQIPTRRFAQPEEIGLAAVFLASDAAAMINGTNLVVDGGYTIQ